MNMKFKYVCLNLQSLGQLYNLSSSTSLPDSLKVPWEFHSCSFGGEEKERERGRTDFTDSNHTDLEPVFKINCIRRGKKNPYKPSLDLFQSFFKRPLTSVVDTKLFFSGSGSCKKFRILAHPDPQHCP
jgi:hypothetical protein